MKQTSYMDAVRTVLAGTATDTEYDYRATPLYLEVSSINNRQKWGIYPTATCSVCNESPDTIHIGRKRIGTQGKRIDVYICGLCLHSENQRDRAEYEMEQAL